MIRYCFSIENNLNVNFNCFICMRLQVTHESATLINQNVYKKMLFEATFLVKYPSKCLVFVC